MSPKKTTPSRPPTKAKSSLPAPRTSQKRVHIPLHQRRTLQAIGAVIVLGIVVLGLWQVHRFWHHHTVTGHIKAAVKAYNNALQSELTPLENLITQAQNSPENYINGAITQANYATQTAQWLTTVETLRGQIAGAKTPGPLQNARGELVQAVDIFIDAVKDFQLAGTTTDKTAAKTLVQNGTNEMAHGEAVLEVALTAEETVVSQFHLPLPPHITANTLKQPAPAPEEVYPINPSPSPS